jgi:hypothetical protein
MLYDPISESLATVEIEETDPTWTDAMEREGLLNLVDPSEPPPSAADFDPDLPF